VPQRGLCFWHVDTMSQGSRLAPFDVERRKVKLDPFFGGQINALPMFSIL
jgi:hypothetical protein